MATLLLVEDNPSMALLLRVTLQALGHRILEARDAEGAWRLCEHAAPDAILLDATLPGAEDGYAFCRRVRATPRLARTPVVMVTGRAAPEEVEAASRAGVDRLVLKPFGPAELRDVVASLLG